MDINVIHDTKGERFVAHIEGDEAYAAYSLQDDTMKLYSTFTPPHLRGRAIAEAIVEHAFNFARENDLKVEPACSYVQTFITRHKEYNYLVIK